MNEKDRAKWLTRAREADAAVRDAHDRLADAIDHRAETFRAASAAGVSYTEIGEALGGVSRQRIQYAAGQGRKKKPSD